MHVLTKIFVVLVSLLAVLLVPLVVVYAHNENSYQAKYQAAEASAATARAALDAANASHVQAITRAETEMEALSQERLRLQADVAAGETELRRLQNDLATATAMDAEINARLSTLALALESSQNLADSLIDEVRGLRKEMLASERRSVDLDERLRDVNSKLEVAVAARRALAEELQRVKDENAAMVSKIARYVERYPQIDNDVLSGQISDGLPPDVALDARVIRVMRNADQDLAEIDAGSRDGVKEGWVIPIAGNGQFVANLRIISVDINRATGIIELENSAARGTVQVGYTVSARPRR